MRNERAAASRVSRGAARGRPWQAAAYEDDDFEGVWIARPDGSRRRLLAPSGVDPAWSPAGRLIAYNNYSVGTFVASVDGSSKWRLRDPGDLAWSPDGHELALDNGRSLRIVGFRGKHARTLATADPPPFVSPFERLAWSASNWLSYRRGEELFIVSPIGGVPRSLATGLMPSTNFYNYFGDYADFAWSPDGRRVAFARDGGLWVMTVPDGTPRLVVPGQRVGFGAAPQWSPDGRLIAYVRGARHGYNVFTVPANGGQPALFGTFNDRTTGEEFVVDIDWRARPRR